MEYANVDGDVVVYITGFAAEERWYKTEDGTICNTIKQAKDICKNKGQDPSKISIEVDAEPKSHALKLVKNILSRVKDRTGAKEVRVFLSGNNNFREKVAVTRPYKGNRHGGRPYHYDNIRKYLIDVHNAEVINGMEADDALGIHQTEQTCICTIDKDLDMIPGWHYNLKNDRLYTVRKDTAMYNFYRQLLTGDPVDNIQGIPGIGKVKATKILGQSETEEDMYWAVLEAYARYYPRPYEAMLEMGQLLYILKEEDGIWKTKY